MFWKFPFPPSEMLIQFSIKQSLENRPPPHFVNFDKSPKIDTFLLYEALDNLALPNLSGSSARPLGLKIASTSHNLKYQPTV